MITWVLVSIFLALALNPAVEWFMRHGVKSARRGGRRSPTSSRSSRSAAIGYAFIPTLVSQVNDFVQAVPGYVDDLTKGRGRLGFLETKYHIVEKIRDAVDERRRDEGARPDRRGDLDHEERDLARRRDRSRSRS